MISNLRHTILLDLGVLLVKKTNINGSNIVFLENAFKIKNDCQQTELNEDSINNIRFFAVLCG
jgi:hypothetical protein